MQAYSRAALAPLAAAPSVSSVSSRAKGADSAVAKGAPERPVDVVTAVQSFASLLLEGLSNQDLAALARRLLPHLQENQPDGARAHSAYAVASLAAELGVSAKAVRCAIARHELQAVKRGSRWIISADAANEWASAPEAHHATARRRSRPLPQAPKAAGPSLRSVLCDESQAARRGKSRRLAMSVEKITRAGGDSGVARAVAAAGQEPCTHVQHSPRRPRLRRGGPAAAPCGRPRSA